MALHYVVHGCRRLTAARSATLDRDTFRHQSAALGIRDARRRGLVHHRPRNEYFDEFKADAKDIGRNEQRRRASIFPLCACRDQRPSAWPIEPKAGGIQKLNGPLCTAYFNFGSTIPIVFNRRGRFEYETGPATLLFDLTKTFTTRPPLNR